MDRVFQSLRNLWHGGREECRLLSAWAHREVAGGFMSIRTPC